MSVGAPLRGLAPPTLRPHLPFFVGYRLDTALQTRSLRSLDCLRAPPFPPVRLGFVRSRWSLPLPLSLRSVLGDYRPLRSVLVLSGVYLFSVGWGLAYGALTRPYSQSPPLRGGVGGARPKRHGAFARAPSPGLRPPNQSKATATLFPLTVPTMFFWAPSVGVARALARRSSVWWGLFRATARLYVHSLVSSALSGGSPLSRACRLCARFASHSPWAPRSS